MVPPKTCQRNVFGDALSCVASAPSASGLELAVRARNPRATHAVLAALPAAGRAAAARRASERWTPSSPRCSAAGQACQASFCSGTSSGSGGVDVEVLELLLSAGADPLQLLPRLLQRYEASIQVGQEALLELLLRINRADPACSSRHCPPHPHILT